MEYAKNIDSMAADIYRYLSFDQIAEFRDAAERPRSRSSKSDDA